MNFAVRFHGKEYVCVKGVERESYVAFTAQLSAERVNVGLNCVRCDWYSNMNRCSVTIFGRKNLLQGSFCFTFNIS